MDPRAFTEGWRPPHVPMELGVALLRQRGAYGVRVSIPKRPSVPSLENIPTLPPVIQRVSEPR